MELGIAAYFSITTLSTLLQWHILDHVFERSEVWEIFLDTLFYVYLALRSRRCTSTTIGEDAAVEVPLTQDYQRMNSDFSLATSSQGDGAARVAAKELLV